MGALPAFSLSELRRRFNAAMAIALLLLLAGVVMAIANENAYRTQKKREIAVQAQILSASVAPALLFANSEAAQDYLDALSANANLDAAAVYDGAGLQIAAFHRTSGDPAPTRAAPEPPRFTGGKVTAVTAVVQNSETIGAVYMRVRAQTFWQRVARYGAIAVLVVMAAFFIAVLGRAQRELEDANANLRAQAAALKREIDERAKAEEALLQSRKLEAVGQLTGGVAHDFNNLLTIVLSGLSMLERHTDPARRSATMEAMRHAVERGAGLTRQLLAFSRRQTLRLETVHLARQLHGMRELLERSLRADILVDFDFAEGLWAVRTDPAQFELALINLAVNARDAMPKGGLLTIAARNVEGAPDKPGAFVELSVRDTGVGIPPDVMERVFEPYFTTKQMGQGTGLGLSQVYGFALQSGGAIAIDSTLTEGTSVRLYLPRSEEANGEIAVDTLVATSVKPSGAHVLVVEDDDAVAAFVGDMLTHLGYRQTRVDNARAALDMLERDAAFDLVFSDIVMPGGMHGQELAHEIRRRWPRLPIVLTTGYSGGANAGAGFPILRKPYQLSELEAMLAAALSKSRAA